MVLMIIAARIVVLMEILILLSIRSCCLSALWKVKAAGVATVQTDGDLSGALRVYAENLSRGACMGVFQRHALTLCGAIYASIATRIRSRAKAWRGCKIRDVLR